MFEITVYNEAGQVRVESPRRSPVKAVEEALDIAFKNGLSKADSFSVDVARKTAGLSVTGGFRNEV